MIRAGPLGPGSTLTQAVSRRLAANAAELTQRRRAGAFLNVGDWSIGDMPKVNMILAHRQTLTRKSY